MFLVGFVLYGIHNFNQNPPFNHIVALVMSVAAGIYILNNLFQDTKSVVHTIKEID